jgi:methyl-accepting chemotaxis protein
MSSQAEQLQQAMAFFQVDTGRGARTAVAGKPARTKTLKAPAPRLGMPALAAAGAPDEADFAHF